MLEDKKPTLDPEYEATQNLAGFFALLLKIDRRINPHLYEDNGDTNNTNQSE